MGSERHETSMDELYKCAYHFDKDYLLKDGKVIN